MFPQTSSPSKAYPWRLILFPGIILLIIWIVYNIPNLEQGDPSRADFLYTFVTPQREEQTDYDVTAYRLFYRFQFDDIRNPTLRASVAIDFLSRVPGLKRVVLDFNSSLKVDSVGGDAYRFRLKDRKLFLDLRKRLDEKETGSVVVYIRGWPKRYHPWIVGMGYEVVMPAPDFHEVPWVYTLNPPYGAQTWFPCKDDPRDKADSVIVTAVVPDTLQVVSNGVLVEMKSLPPRRLRYTWKTTYPIATYLIALNVGQFRTYTFSYSDSLIHDLPIQFYVFPEDTPYVEDIRKQIFRMMHFFNRYLIPYPFAREKYAMIRYNSSGGMENQTITGIRLLRPHRERLYAHELAHQWTGNLVTNASFHESYLNEGLATYLTALYWRHQYGDSAFAAYLNRLRASAHGKLFVQNTVIPDSVYFMNAVYYKGALLFHAIHQVIGEERFAAFLRRLLQELAFDAVSTRQLQSLLSRLYPYDWEAFFQQWVYSPGLPANDFSASQ